MLKKKGQQFIIGSCIARLKSPQHPLIISLKRLSLDHKWTQNHPPMNTKEHDLFTREHFFFFLSCENDLRGLLTPMTLLFSVAGSGNTRDTLLLRQLHTWYLSKNKEKASALHFTLHTCQKLLRRTKKINHHKEHHYEQSKTKAKTTSRH